MPSYLVTGASRGLGYEFIRQFSHDSANTVIGVVRDKTATEKKLREDRINNVILFEADIADLDALKAVARELEITSMGGIDYLIANAGLVSKISALRTLADFNDDPKTLRDDLLESFQVNVIGLVNTVSAFIGLVQQGTAKKVIAISSGMADTDMVNEVFLDIAAPYAISKAGVNMVMAKYNALYSKEGVLFMAICPGSVATSAQNPSTSDGLGALDSERLNDLGAKFASYAPNFKGPASPEESVGDIMRLVYKASLEKGDGGSFVSHLGTKRWF